MFSRITEVFPYFCSIFMAVFIVMFAFRKEIFGWVRRKKEEWE